MRVVKIVSSLLFVAGFVTILGAVGSSDIDIISLNDLAIRCTIGGVLMGLASVGLKEVKNENRR